MGCYRSVYYINIDIEVCIRLSVLVFLWGET